MGLHLARSLRIAARPSLTFLALRYGTTHIILHSTGLCFPGFCAIDVEVLMDVIVGNGDSAFAS